MKISAIKILTASAIALTMISINLINVHAAGTEATFGTPAEVAYNFSYKFTTQAMIDRTQKSINYARVEIAELKGTDAEWATGEFSRLLDIIEQEKINNCIALIDKAKASDATSDISNARTVLNELLTVNYNQQILDFVRVLDSRLKSLEV